MIFKKWLFKIALLGYIILFCASPTFAAYNAQSQLVNTKDSLSGQNWVEDQIKLEENLIRNDLETSAESVSSSGIQINEVMFNPAEGENDWIELKNSGVSSQNISGWGLTDENGHWYKFPHNLPDIPVGYFIVVILDGQGSSNNDTDFSDGKMTLHSEPGIVNFLGISIGQAALYPVSEFLYLPMIMSSDSGSSSTPVQTNSSIVSYIAWGGDPGLGATDATINGIWASGIYLNLRQIGEEEFGALTLQGKSIGLLPASSTSFVENWAIYQASEISQGHENIVPSITTYDPPAGAEIDSTTFAISWQGQDGATSYHFQMDNNSDLSSPEYDLILDGPAYIPSGPIPEGKYYWRVKEIQGMEESIWSNPVEINSILYPITLANYSSQIDNAAAILGVSWQLQRKDTKMVCTAQDSEIGSTPWDAPQPSTGSPKPHGINYCERASVSMLASYYGGHLSQERIAYNDYQGTPNDLGHGLTNVNINVTLQWAGIPVTRIVGKPSFATIKSWIDSGRPFISLRPAHFRVIDGYRETQSNGQTIQEIHLLDPYTRDKWQSYSTDDTQFTWVGPSGSSGAPNVRSDEDSDHDGIPDTMDDSDGDGLVDFDEIYRFHSDPNKSDTDGDDVPDKLEIREYVFDNNGQYSPRKSDIDNDGLRKEKDPDNDNDGSTDGCEDSNHNGKYEPNLGETSNFDPNQKNLCLTTHWESFTSPVTSGLNVISMISPSEGWIAGDSGVILHWNGTSWAIQNNGTQGSLRALSMVSSTNGWAGGISNTLLHYNGTTWSPVTLPNNSSIWSIGMLSASDGWLIGQDPSSLSPVPYRWNGSQWIKQTSSPTWPLSRLAIIDSNNIWGAVGALNCAPNCDDFVGSYSHWNGTTWTSTPLTHRAIWGLVMLDANNGWMTGIQKDTGSGTLHSLIMKWDGTTWSDISHPDSFLLNGVAANSNTFALAVGYNGSILQWDGSSWTSMVSPTTTELRDVAIVSSTEAWAIGASGTILHYTP